ncbi:penicillin acylase family protein [Flavilitoribacter nigricans]|uniref:Acylase n=1 Tax=Flavilitoribacter nigricans (strain ATCC 23147 / DSM 23189 / NBRC 102662 / NCIMB 1420 / SS-2) TaxID=1122177 RepID=A0A2D0N714_FLAN2|nr:penicillin acylase family protein [Flavilitoribacter nigricans]PHN04176.1 acylase [Flavilitoribacter nigricans DSM 23189 = NBRC 102662]
MRIACFFLFLAPTLFSQSVNSAEISRWEARAQSITIIRDTWGIPHIYAKTDADAVFGMLYAQCEDDFQRVEENYLDATGQMAMAYGEDLIYHDLRARMFLDSNEAKAYYRQSPAWMKALCNGFADGINYYLHTHPEVEPKFLTRFEPWMPFTFSEGSIGGDITRISLRGLEAFYGQDRTGYVDTRWALEEEPTGSNGFAIAPEKSESGNALFLINPHTSFYFRSEQHVNSEEGLSVYGAATWGQFFIYQGFNENCGWMHTSTYADAIDQYEETIIKKGDRFYYQYGDEQRPVEEHRVTIPFRDGDSVGEREFTFYKTHHGPIIRSEGEKWISFRMMNRPLDALTQSYLRTKAKGYRSFRKTMKIRTNSSNNTVYADRQGNIGYWHGNFIPKRDPNYDYNGLIDGSNPATDWGRLLKLKEMIHVRNPASGWIQNCNSTPYTVAGSQGSPDPDDYANYIAPDRENFRGINAVRVLGSRNSYDLDGLIRAANDPFLAAFEKPIPALLAAYREVTNMGYPPLDEAIKILQDWDLGYGESSVATSLAVYWGEDMLNLLRDKVDAATRRELMTDELMVQHTTPEEKLAMLVNAIRRLESDFGDWKTPWGAINRYQRRTGAIRESFDDDAPSLPVGFASSRWGSLASYGARTYPNTKKRYGSGGNSFVAVVEFGDRLQARAVVSGGQSGDPDSPHFTDQAELFTKAQFRPVYFYRTDVEQHQERTYRPGK